MKYVFDFIPFREDMLKRDIGQALVRDVCVHLVLLLNSHGHIFHAIVILHCK